MPGGDVILREYNQEQQGDEEEGHGGTSAISRMEGQRRRLHPLGGEDGDDCRSRRNGEFVVSSSDGGSPCRYWSEKTLEFEQAIRIEIKWCEAAVKQMKIFTFHPPPGTDLAITATAIRWGTR